MIKDYPPYLDYRKPKKAQTNYDLLIQKSPKEMADWIETIVNCDVCQMRGNCRGADGTSHGSCRLKWLDWLRQEVTDD